MAIKRAVLFGAALLASAAFADTYTWNNVVMGGGGMVTGLIPTNENGVMYARTDVGGAYRWNAASAKWTPLLDWLSQADVGLYGVESMAADPQNAARVYLLTGTSYYSNGKTVVMRSKDYGATFDTTDVTSKWKAHGNGDGRQAGEKLAVDPNNPAILFCGTRSNTLYKSTDTAKTWTLANSSFGSANANGVNFVLFDSTSVSGGKTQRIFVGVGASGGLYVSTDGGSSFSKVSNVPSYIPHRAMIAGGNLYVTFTSGIGPWGTLTGGFYRYSISGGTWTSLTPSGCSSCGYGNVSVDKSNTNRILLSTSGMWSNQQTYSATNKSNWGDYIFLSTDGGSSWTVVNKNIANNGFKWLDGNAIHVASSAVFNPFNTKEAWVNSGNGIFETSAFNGTGTVWNFMVKGVEETVPLDIVSIPDGPLAVAVGDYDGGVYTDVSQSVALPNPSIGTTTGLAYAYTKKRLVRAGASAIYYSDDAGSSWTKLSTMNGVKGKLAISADGSVIIHRPMDSNENFTGTVYYTTDLGASWNTVSGLSLATGSNIVCDPGNASYCYALNSSGCTLVSSNGGKSFSTSGCTGSSSFGYMRIVPGREGHLWAPLSGNGLAYSTDKGATWTKLSGVYADAVGIGKAAAGASYETLFIWGYTSGSSTKGIYRSTDKGATWVRINDDTHQFGGPGNGNFVIGDMNTYGRVYMSTVGRGLVYGDVSSATTDAPAAFMTKASPVSLKLAGGILQVSVSSSLSAEVRIYDMQGKLLRSSPVYAGESSVSLNGLGGQILVVRLVSGNALLGTESFFVK